MYTYSLLAQVVGTTDRETLGLLLKFLLFTATGAAVKRVVDWLVRELNDRPGHEPVSPRTTRWLSYAVSAVLPTVLYLVYTLWLAFEPYRVETHIMTILYAFGVSQFVHGVLELPGGKEQRELGLTDATRLPETTRMPPVPPDNPPPPRPVSPEPELSRERAIQAPMEGTEDAGTHKMLPD